jgi:hypothetical protein
MDEGVSPPSPFPAETASPVEEIKTAEPDLAVSDLDEPASDDDELKNEVMDVPLATPAEMPAFLAQAENETRWRGKPWTLGAIVFAVVLVLTVIGVPWGMYARNKAAKLAMEAPTVPVANPETSAPAVPANETSAASAPEETVVPAANSGDAEQLAKRQREARAKERARAQETAPTALTGNTQPEARNTPSTANPSSVKPQSSPSAAGRKVTVQVTYDENGRVTQASGGDATALRIARQKRFPAGKAGSATVTIPIN